MTGVSPVSPALERIGRAAADEHGYDPGLLHGYLPSLLAAASSLRRLSEHEKQECRRTGAEAATTGLPLPALVDLYMTASRRVWPELPGLVGTVRGRRVPAGEVVRLGEVLWRAADDALAAIAAGYVDAQTLVVREEEAARQQFVQDLLQGRSDIGRLVGEAAERGLNLAGGHLVAVARSEQPAAPQGSMTTRVEQAARGRFPDGRVLVTADAGRLVCVLSTAGTHRRDDPDVAALGLLVAGALEDPAGSGARVAVSRRHGGPLGISRGYAEAVDALDVAGRLRHPDRVVHAAQLLVYQVLLRDESAMTDLVEAVLGPLAETAEGPDRLLSTLDAYFAAGGNATAAARQLRLGVRALVYRLQRVEHLTGYRAADPSHQLTLAVAVTGARLLGWPEPARARP